MDPARITRIAVLGAGTMGHGIAHASAAAGYATSLYDPSDEALATAIAAIGRIVERAIERHVITEPEGRAVVSRMGPTTDLARAVGEADFVIEAAPERIDLKLSLLGAIDRAAPSHARFATNTSALSITEMATALERPSRLGGMHFFNPVHRMRLVEVVRALDTDGETLTAIEHVARRMGKETVTVRESAGFVTSRVNALIGNEAFYMLQEGVASARDIDKALKLGLNHPMGPFELVDLVGLDTRLAVLQHLHKSLGEKYRPCPLLAQYVQAGRLGRKVGRGVYEYPGSPED
jgi:3-hydroxybutyryl-CoA dehydrogenase